jgi:hypothetical protein
MGKETLMHTAEKLIADLTAARVAAEATTTPWADGGSCNIDSCVLDLRKKPKGIDVEAALAAAGLPGFYSKGGFWRGWFIGAPKGGQANMRTKQVEAIYKTLKEQGWEVCMYYQMD